MSQLVLENRSNDFNLSFSVTDGMFVYFGEKFSKLIFIRGLRMKTNIKLDLKFDILIYFCNGPSAGL